MTCLSGHGSRTPEHMPPSHLLSLQDQAASTGTGMHPPSRSSAASARSPSSCCSSPLSVTAALEALSCARPASSSAFTLAGEGGRAGRLKCAWRGSEARQTGVAFSHPEHHGSNASAAACCTSQGQLAGIAHLRRCSACSRLCRSFTRSCWVESNARRVCTCACFAGHMVLFWLTGRHWKHAAPQHSRAQWWQPAPAPTWCAASSSARPRHSSASRSRRPSSRSWGRKIMCVSAIRVGGANSR